MGEAQHAEMRLEGVCAGEHASTLKSRILEHRGQNLAIDLTGVDTIDTPNIEVLVAAARLWSSDGKILNLKELTPEFSKILEGVQIRPEEFESKGNDDA